MTDPYDYTPLRQHIANVLEDHRQGGTDSLDDAVQAIMDHPEFAQAGWQRWADAPDDGTPFLFMTRSLATALWLPPIVGRFHEGELQSVQGAKWGAWGSNDARLWAPIPTLPG